MTIAASPQGRRERKKAATRQAIADAALELFLERGFDDVSVRDVADRADVSVTTLFAHFPSKEALVFDREDDFEEDLLGAVRARTAGTGVVDAIREHALRSWLPLVDDPALVAFAALVRDTPALREYDEQRWRRHGAALARVLAEESGSAQPDVGLVALAQFIVEIPVLVASQVDPAAAMRELFALLLDGWRTSLQEP